VARLDLRPPAALRLKLKGSSGSWRPSCSWINTEATRRQRTSPSPRTTASSHVGATAASPAVAWPRGPPGGSRPFSAIDRIAFYAAIRTSPAPRREARSGGAYATRASRQQAQQRDHYDPATRSIHTQLGRNRFSSIANIGSFASRAYTRGDRPAALPPGLWADRAPPRRPARGGWRAGIFETKLNQRSTSSRGGYLSVPGWGRGLPGGGPGLSAERAPHAVHIENVCWGRASTMLKRSALADAGFPTSGSRHHAPDPAHPQDVARCTGRMGTAILDLATLFHAMTRRPTTGSMTAPQQVHAFAPATGLASRRLLRAGFGRLAAEFMTVLDVEPESGPCPAVVHVDRTAAAARQAPIPTSTDPVRVQRLTGIESLIRRVASRGAILLAGGRGARSPRADHLAPGALRPAAGGGGR
jgi:hypothetical protein